MIRVHPTALAEYLDQVRVSPGELRDLYPPAPAATTGQLHRPVAKSTGNNWLGVPALAEELGVTLRTVYAILDAGEIPC